MDTSTIVNIILCVLSFVLAAVSVITVIITLKQNALMIDNATRPYITVYSAVTDFQGLNYYFCVKNFGQSGATITSFSCDYDLSKCSFSDTNIPFEHLTNSFIAPGQSFICSVDHIKLFKNPQPITFSITYKAEKRTYSDAFTINLKTDSDSVHMRANTKGNELSVISYALQEIAERLL